MFIITFISKDHECIVFKDESNIHQKQNSDRSWIENDSELLQSHERFFTIGSMGEISFPINKNIQIVVNDK